MVPSPSHHAEASTSSSPPPPIPPPLPSRPYSAIAGMAPPHASRRRNNHHSTFPTPPAIDTTNSDLNLLCCEETSACLLDSDTDADPLHHQELRSDCFECDEQSSSSPWKLRSEAPTSSSGQKAKEEEEEEEVVVAAEDDPSLREEDHSDVENAVCALVDREIFHIPESDYSKKYRTHVLDVSCRQNAIAWLFKVTELYNFNSLTSSLSVNYLDRFLSRHSQISKGKAWMIQLLSVACLSLAAKMEETEVPLLLDLQVGQKDCFIFEPRTIQRMELLVLSTLEWRVSSVTPFSYIDYFIRKLDLHGCSRCNILRSRATEFLLSSVKELRFIDYRPSSIAVAALLCAIQCTMPLICSESKKALTSMLPAGLQGPTEICYKMMSELYLSPVRKGDSCTNSVPQSPIGVLDASFSTSDSESTLKSMGSSTFKSVRSDTISSPLLKRRRVDDFCSSVNTSAP